ncbi:MAG: polysaccharide deacetylase family protein [Desulfobacteraceae bacterium]|nr:polysaccharide deacetylase family protein [Desulfobacteraceae bacterium]
MSNVPTKTGHFVFSLDTELAWGFFDLDRRRSKQFSSDGTRERRSIERLLDVLDEFGIVGTWAIVGHLFYEKCEVCDICPILEWKGRYQSFEEVYKTEDPLWYGADIVEALLARGSQHEFAFHGYTHEVFEESRMSEEAARIEIQEWLRLSMRKGIVPQAVIFPRGLVGHLRVFKEAGFICYRSEEDLPRLFRLSYVGKLIKSIDHILSLSTPPVYDLNGVGPRGLVNLRSSQHFFGFNRKLEMILDSVNLHKLRINRMIKGVKKAADEKKIIHIWAHPWEFRTEKDFEKLRYLLGYVSEETNQGRIQSIGMAALAEIAMNRFTVTE